jgi:peptidoglycan/LPS O-acetylase OafA/YrhL
MAGPTNDRPFFGRVESLRGLGALAVAGYHFNGCGFHGVPLVPPIPWDGLGFLGNLPYRLSLAAFPGHAALMVFFVISGFVLRLALAYGPPALPAAAAKFALGRVFRLYPIVIVAVILTALVSPSEPTRPLTVSLLCSNMLLLDASMNGTYWALQVELLMVPVIFCLYRCERAFGARVLVGAALLTTVLAFHKYWVIWPPLSTNVFPFILGMTIPTLGSRFARSLSHRAASRLALLTCVALFLPAAFLGQYTRYGAILEAYTAVVLISLVAYRPDLTVLAWLDAWPLRKLGLCSGSYYVLHMLFGGLVLALLAMVVPAAWSGTAPVLVGFLVLVACLVALGSLMLGCYYLIEAPGIALGRLVSRALRLDAGNVPRPPQEGRSRPLAA